MVNAASAIDGSYVNHSATDATRQTIAGMSAEDLTACLDVQSRALAHRP
jgi:hypothetical protein